MEIFCGGTDFESRDEGFHTSGISTSATPSAVNSRFGTPCGPLEIPDHVLIDVMNDFLDDPIDSQIRLSSVCRRWDEALSDRLLWKIQLQKRFGKSEKLIHPRFRLEGLSNQAFESDTHPKEIYGATHSLEKKFMRGEYISHSRSSLRSVVTCISISAEGIFSGDVEGKIWKHRYPDVRDSGGLVVEGILSSPSPVSALHALQDFNALLSGHSNGSISLWTSSTRVKLAVHEPASRVTSISSTQHSILSVSSSDCSLRSTDLNTGLVRTIRRFPTEAIPTSISAPLWDPNTVVAGFRDECARIFDLRTENEGIVFPLSDWCLCVETCEDVHKFRASDKSVKLFDARRNSEPVEQRHKSNRLVSKFKSDSALRLVSCGLDGKVKVSSLETEGGKDPVAVHSSEDYMLAVDFDRTTLVCGGMSGELELFGFN